MRYYTFTCSDSSSDIGYVVIHVLTIGNLLTAKRAVRLKLAEFGKLHLADKLTVTHQVHKSGEDIVISNIQRA